MNLVSDGSSKDDFILLNQTKAINLTRSISMATKKPATVIYKKKTYTALVPEQTTIVDGKFVVWNGEHGKGGRTNVVTLGIVTNGGYGISLDKTGRPTATYKHVAPFEG